MNPPTYLRTGAEPKDEIVTTQNIAKPEKPGVEPIPDSKDLGEMFTQATMEHIDLLRQFEGRAKKARAATELGKAKKLEEEQVKLKEERVQEDLDMAKRLEEEQVNLKEERVEEDIDRLEIIKAKKNKIAKLKEMEAELAQEAMAAKILEDFQERNAKFLETKAAAKLKEAEKLVEETKNQEKIEEGASERQDSM